MICEKCKGKMNWSIEGATQGWRCPMCGWNIITTYIEDIDRDETEYSLYIKNVTEVDAEKIKFVAKTANVNFVIAKQMLEKREACILKAKAPKIKLVITKLQDEYYGAAEPPVRCGESHLSGLTEPLRSL